MYNVLSKSGFYCASCRDLRPLLGEEVVAVMDMIYLTHPVVADILFVISTKVFVTSLLGWKRMIGKPARCEENKASAALGYPDDFMPQRGFELVKFYWNDERSTIDDDYAKTIPVNSP